MLWTLIALFNEIKWYCYKNHLTREHGLGKQVNKRKRKQELNRFSEAIWKRHVELWCDIFVEQRRQVKDRITTSTPSV